VAFILWIVALDFSTSFPNCSPTPFNAFFRI
jgi:hypothetical protein